MKFYNKLSFPKSSFILSDSSSLDVMLVPIENNLLPSSLSKLRVGVHSLSGLLNECRWYLASIIEQQVLSFVLWVEDTLASYSDIVLQKQVRVQWKQDNLRQERLFDCIGFPCSTTECLSVQFWAWKKSTLWYSKP